MEVTIIGTRGLAMEAVEEEPSLLLEGLWLHKTLSVQRMSTGSYIIIDCVD